MASTVSGTTQFTDIPETIKRTNIIQNRLYATQHFRIISFNRDHVSIGKTRQQQTRLRNKERGLL